MDAVCTQKQNGRICALFHNLGWNEFVYGSWLKAYYQVETVPELTMKQASALIKDLQDILAKQQRNTGATEDPRMITEKQATYLKTLWLDVDYSRGDIGDKHLSAFLEHRFRVKKVNDLTCKQAIACIYMVKRLLVQAQEREGKTTVLEKKGKCRYCGKPIMWVQLADGRRVPFDFDEHDKATDFHECADKRHAADR